MSAADLLAALLSDDLLAALSSTYDQLAAQATTFAQHLERSVRHGAAVAYAAYANSSAPVRLEFSELQTSLLSVFLVIIAVNVLLIAYYWNKYGGVITDRFIRPSTLKEIEELKLSVAKLKLPFEHSPRL